MNAPRSLWLACADRKPLIKDDSWEKALAAYDAEMDEAEMRAARAVRDECKRVAGNASDQNARGDAWIGMFLCDDDELRAVIEKARRVET